ncbi:MAG: helix-turn-helix transcriptional regulator [Bacteroidetes bacterium]|nr:helix-turn-helix transcriptional regulator [Bacteroidota bacterium]
MKIGEKIRQERLKKGISQDWLVSKTGISQFIMSKIETGAKAPNVEQLTKIADALEIPLAKFFDVPINQEFTNCSDCGHNFSTITIQFPKELIELIKKLSDKL